MTGTAEQTEGTAAPAGSAAPYPVPVIDLASGRTRATAAPVLDAVRAATETVGLVQVVGHGLPLHLVGALAAGPRPRDLALRFIAAGQPLAERVLGLYARAQGLPEGIFPVDPFPRLSFTAPGRPAGPCVAAGLYEDLPLTEPAGGSVLTVLAQPGGSRGLEVQLPGGQWRPVPAVPGALPVLTGSLLARWTGGRLRQARHRVAATVTAGQPAAVLCYPALGRVTGPLAP